MIDPQFNLLNWKHKFFIPSVVEVAQQHATNVKYGGEFSLKL